MALCNAVNGSSEDDCTVQCKGKWPSAPQPLCISMFTVPSTLLCFDNLSSQNSLRKGSSVGLHKCMYTHTHTSRQSYEWRKQSPRQSSEGQRASRGAVITAAGRRRDARGSLVMGVNCEVLIRSHFKPT